MGVLLLILGVGSLIFQYSTTANVYAQVSVGPLWNMGEGDTADKSVSQDSDSDGTDIFVAYQREGVKEVKLGKVVPNTSTGERGEAEDDDPQVIIDGGADPAIDVTPGGQVKVAAEQQGEIAFVGCDNDDDACQPSKIVSIPTTGPPPVGIEGEGGSGSCTDNLDNDGDGRTDVADVDCKYSSEQESSQRGLCSDRQDNDNDTRIDSDDEDCFHPSGTAGAVDTAETAGAEEDNGETAGAEEDNGETAGAEEDNGETAGAEEDNDTADVEPTSFNLQPGTTSSPQLTFVSTDGGDARI